MAITSFIACMLDEVEIIQIDYQVILKKKSSQKSSMSSWQGLNEMIETKGEKWVYNWQERSISFGHYKKKLDFMSKYPPAKPGALICEPLKVA